MRTIDRASRFAGAVALLCCLQALAGNGARAEPTEGAPAPSNIRGSECPCVLPDNRVVFEIEAPNAGQVQIDLGRIYDLRKNESGPWTVTTDPLDPGFHYYSLVIDGVRVSDPASQAYFGTGRMSSAIEIPEAGADFYTVKDVPHGSIRSNRYFSEVTDSWRRLYVYTPPGYDESPGTRYPVLYLQHGGGEDETGWVAQGRTDIILDNLMAEGRARPMLVVIANGNVPVPEGAPRGYNRAAMAGFADELLNNIVPFVERSYRALATADNRALAGLSMGGGQAFFVGLGNKESFGAVGMFSTGLFGGIGRPGGGGGADGGAFSAEEHVPGLLSEAQTFNDALDVFYISVGEQDPRFEHTKKAVADFRSHGLDVQFASFPGGHEWQVWRKSLHDFAQRVFRQAGIRGKRPVFGGACKVCPWGTMAEVVQAAMRPYGYDVQICHNCNAVDAPRIVSEARTPPPYKPDPHLPEILAPRNVADLGNVDFGAVAIQFLRDAYRGKGLYANEEPRTNLRVIANIQHPTYTLVAAKAETGITDLSQIREKRWPVRALTAGVGRSAETILAHFGLSREVIEAAGGHVGNAPEDQEDFDVAIGGGGDMSTAPEWSIWSEISQKHTLTFIELPDDLLATLAREGEQERGTIPVGLYPGVVRPIPTVVRTGTVVYGRDDMPDGFAYDVAKALDEQQQLLQWRHLGFSYNVHTVWNAHEVPLHPGAARYYKEAGYLK